MIKDNPKREYNTVHNLGVLVWLWMKCQRDQEYTKVSHSSKPSFCSLLVPIYSTQNKLSFLQKKTCSHRTPLGFSPSSSRKANFLVLFFSYLTKCQPTPLPLVLWPFIRPRERPFESNDENTVDVAVHGNHACKSGEAQGLQGLYRKQPVDWTLTGC